MKAPTGVCTAICEKLRRLQTRVGQCDSIEKGYSIWVQGSALGADLLAVIAIPIMCGGHFAVCSGTRRGEPTANAHRTPPARLAD